MKLEVRAAEDRDLPEIKRQIDEYISPEYLSLPYLEEQLHREGTLFYVMTDADRDDRIVSYFYSYLSTLEEALADLHARGKTPEALAGYAPRTLVGVYKTSSTVREYQKLGICSSFIRGVEPVMRERGAKMILATAMRSPEGAVPMRQIFLGCGYSEIAELIRPWESLDIYCIYCKRHHCVCDAVFYMKKIDETEKGDTCE